MSILRNAAQSVTDRLSRQKKVRNFLLRSIFSDEIHAVRNFGSFDLVFDPREHIGRHLLDGGSYQKNILDEALRFLTENSLIREGSIWLELGANIGTHAVYAAQYDIFRKFVLVETDKSLMQYLKTNLLLNDILENSILYNGAVGAGPAEGVLKRAIANAGATSVRRLDQSRPRPDDPPVGDDDVVAIDTVENIMSRLKVEPSEIGMVWMDIEGGEFEAFCGMHDLLESGVPIVFELGESSGPMAECPVIDTITDRYGRFKVLGGGGESSDIADIARVKGLCDILIY